MPDKVENFNTKVEDGWQGFRAAVYPKEGPDADQLNEARNIFFAGCLHMFGVLITRPEEEPDEVGAAMLAGIKAELRHFYDHYMLSQVTTKGSA